MEEEKKTRKIVKADGTETEAPVKKTAPKRAAAKPAAAAVPEGNATGFRIGAFVLWFLGIACEVVAIMILTNKIYLGDKQTTWFIAALVADLVFVLVANFLWKKSNRIDPASEANKVKFFLHNNLGVLMSLIAFVPIIILVLKDKKNLDEKTKKFVAIGLIAALLICSVAGIDFNPISKEAKEAQLAEAEALSIGTVYWSTFGHKYHYDPDCQAIKNSDTLYEGSVEQAIQGNRTELCKFCESKYAASAIDVADEAAEALEGTVEEALTDVAEEAAEVAPAA